MSKNEIIECAELFIEALQNDVFAWIKIENKINDLSISFRNKLFMDSLKVFLDEYTKNTSKQERQIGKMLENSKYRAEYGKALLKYIDDMEVDSQVEFLARLTAALSKRFINSDEFFEFARKIKTTSFVALKFLKEHIGLVPYSLKDSLHIQELSNNNLMYKASIGYCFTPWAFYLDKFALSFGNEKYKYNGEPDFVPPLEKFPGVTGVISTGTVKNPFVDKIE